MAGSGDAHEVACGVPASAILRTRWHDVVLCCAFAGSWRSGFFTDSTNHVTNVTSRDIMFITLLQKVQIKQRLSFNNFAVLWMNLMTLAKLVLSHLLTRCEGDFRKISCRGRGRPPASYGWCLAPGQPYAWGRAPHMPPRAPKLQGVSSMSWHY